MPIDGPLSVCISEDILAIDKLKLLVPILEKNIKSMTNGGTKNPESSAEIISGLFVSSLSADPPLALLPTGVGNADFIQGVPRANKGIKNFIEVKNFKIIYDEIVEIFRYRSDYEIQLLEGFISLDQDKTIAQNAGMSLAGAINYGIACSVLYNSISRISTGYMKRYAIFSKKDKNNTNLNKSIAINAKYIEGLALHNEKNYQSLTNLKKLDSTTAKGNGKVVHFISCKFQYAPEAWPKFSGSHPVIAALQKTIKDLQAQIQHKEQLLEYLIKASSLESRRIY